MVRYYDFELRSRAWDRLVTKGRVGVTDAAYILQCNPQTVTHRIATGKIEAVKVGTRYQITLKAMEDYIAEMDKKGKI